MNNNNKNFKPITLSVVLSSESNKRLSESAEKAGRSKRIEAMLRIAHHLKTVPEVDGDYWEIIADNTSS
ncbi:TraY domain-containing protein [Yersinia sp. 2538 StPb PI]|nr:TraY domain-containing protein [Yersinia enterocolitica]